MDSIKNLEMMVAKTNKYVGGRSVYRLTHDLVISFPVGVTGEFLVIVPRGFETDFASIPRSMGWLYPPDGPWAIAAVVHDWLYRRGSGVSRYYADSTFMALMECLGVPYCRRNVIYHSVRFFGGRFFHKQEPMESVGSIFG